MTHTTRALAGAAAAATAAAFLSAPAQADKNFQTVACNQIPNVGKLCIDRSADGKSARGRLKNLSGVDITGTGGFQPERSGVKPRLCGTSVTTGKSQKSICVVSNLKGKWRVAYKQAGKTIEYAPQNGTYVNFG